VGWGTLIPPPTSLKKVSKLAGSYQVAYKAWGLALSLRHAWLVMAAYEARRTMYQGGYAK
jgi:hypothetical protein